jgi:AcrR family transcriptional regulator
MYVRAGATTEPASGRRGTQADRSARTRSALLESAARGLSRYGYGNLILERVASEAGYTRGALYHQFKDKEDLALAVIDWVDETWREEVGRLVVQESDPVVALIVLARGHAVYCRRDVARVAMALRLEFSGQDHPVGRHLERVSEGLVKRCTRLIRAGRRAGTIPAGPPARAVALAFIGAMEGTVIQLAGQAPHDEVLAARAVAGVLGLDHDLIAHALPGERPRPMHPFRSAVETGEADRVLDLVSPDVVFNSPVVFRPYRGRETLGVILRAVIRVFEDFRYEREIGAEGGSDHALLFRARVGDRELHGCDFLHIGEDGLIEEFTVMVRPLSAALALAEAMKAELLAVQRELGVETLA